MQYQKIKMQRKESPVLGVLPSIPFHITLLEHGGQETKNLLKSCAENVLNAVSRLENRPQVSSSVTPCGSCGTSSTCDSSG